MMMLVAYNTIHTLVDLGGPKVVVVYVGLAPLGARDVIQCSDWLVLVDVASY